MTRSRRSLRIASLIALVCALFVSDLAEARRGRRHRRRHRTTQKAKPAQALTPQAQAKPAKPVAVSAEFKAFAQRHGMTTALHKGKLFIKVDSSKLNKNWDAFCKIGGGKVLEFNGRTHLFTRYNGKRGADFLEQLDLDTYSAPTSPRVTTVVRLNTAEHKELDTYIRAASKNSQKEIGTFNYYGGRPKRYYPGSTTANCTSWIAAAKLDGKRSLGETCGVGTHAAPSTFIKSLARKGNDRVEAVLLHHFKGDVNNWREVDAFISSSMKK